jgi:hypothetical protein
VPDQFPAAAMPGGGGQALAKSGLSATLIREYRRILRADAYRFRNPRFDELQLIGEVAASGASESTPESSAVLMPQPIRHPRVQRHPTILRKQSLNYRRASVFVNRIPRGRHPDIP